MLCGGLLASVAVTVKVVLPKAVGVPEITPTPLALPASVNPAGKVPAVTVQVIGSVPPLV